MTIRSLIPIRWLAPAVLALLLGACAAPATSGGGTPDDGGSVQDLAAKPAADTPASTPPARPPQLPPVQRPIERPSLGPGLPGRNTGGSATGGTVTVDRSCESDAECTVKNVGNCCGHYPACVNVDSPTDPEGVQAACAKSGMASVCGFPAISSCQCVQGTCQGDSRALLD